MFKHLITVTTLCTLVACSQSAAPPPAAVSGITPQVYTDSLYAVMSSDRANYTQLIISRLGPDGIGVIKPNEYWEEHENGAPLPAQMFRFGSEKVAEKTSAFTYQLKSLWPINAQNGPRTPMEEAGLTYIAEHPGENFYGEEELGGVTYYTAVYPDTAVANSCINCHNGHIDSPRTDFVMGEVMGGVVIRVPL